MSDDDEALVRQRLLRVVGGRERFPFDAPDRGAAGPVEVPRPAVPGPAVVPHRSAAAGSARSRQVAERGVPWPGEDVVRTLDHLTPDPDAVPGEPVPASDPAEPSPPSTAPRRLTGSGAFDPGRGGVRALAVVTVLVVIAAGAWAWWSRPRPEPVPVASDAPADATFPGTPRPGTSEAQVVVAVAGKVHRPGLVRLPAGSRVADALAAAGGALPGVDVALLNPARRVTDGELILVGVTAPPGAGGPAAPGAGAGVGGMVGGKVNLNTATLADLDGLPGVGPVLAQRILDHRTKLGGFRAVSDLRQVDGIGESRFEQLKDLVTV